MLSRYFYIIFERPLSVLNSQSAIQRKQTSFFIMPKKLASPRFSLIGHLDTLLWNQFVYRIADSNHPSLNHNYLLADGHP